MPIVPVRFSGGLPREPLEQRTEFPVDMGQQDVWFGRPIHPESLKAMPYGERKKVVLAAMNNTGPSCADETPLPGDPEFAARVAELAQSTGASEEHAALLALLQQNPAPSPGTARLLRGLVSSDELAGDDAESVWLRVVAGWFGQA